MCLWHQAISKHNNYPKIMLFHSSNVIMSPMASQITGVSIVGSTVCSCADQRKHRSFASLAFVRGIHRWPIDSPHKGPVTRNFFQLMTSSCEVSFPCNRGWALKDTSQKQNGSHSDHLDVFGRTRGCHSDSYRCVHNNHIITTYKGVQYHFSGGLWTVAPA